MGLYLVRNASDSDVLVSEDIANFIEEATISGCLNW